jgi:DNA polymerase III sliding clamp (beta) subunit (PCNA family)
MNIIATSLLIHGNFPEYENENIMPKNFNTTVIVDKNSIDKAIKKIGIMTKDINNYVVLGITNDGINIQS